MAPGSDSTPRIASNRKSHPARRPCRLRVLPTSKSISPPQACARSHLGTHVLLATPILRGRQPTRDRRVRMKKPFHPLGRSSFRQILLGELVHRGNERLHTRDGLKCVPV